MIEDAALSFFAIGLTAICYSLLSRYIQKRIGNRDRVKEIQDEVNRINTKLKSAVGSGNEKKQQEAEAEQEKLADLLKESMMLQFKPLLVSLPMFIGISWALRQVFPTFSIKLAFSIPVVIQNLENFPNWRDTFGPVGWFVIALLVSGILMQVIVSRIEALKGKKK